MAQRVKNLGAKQETCVRLLGWEDPLEKGLATHSSILAWRIPLTEEPGHRSLADNGPWGRKQLDTTKRLTHTLINFEHTLAILPNPKNPYFYRLYNINILTHTLEILHSIYVYIYVCTHMYVYKCIQICVYLCSLFMLMLSGKKKQRKKIFELIEKQKIIIDQKQKF